MTDNGKVERIRSKEYPPVTISDAIGFLENFKDFPRDRPIAYSIAAKQIGVSTSTRSFTNPLSASRQYGLLTTSTGRVFHITETGRRLIRQIEDEKVIKLLLFECFKLPKLNMEIIEAYLQKGLPEVKLFKEILIANFGIAPKVANNAASVFVENANYVGALVNGVVVKEYTDNTTTSIEVNNTSNQEEIDNSHAVSSINNTRTQSIMIKQEDGFGPPLTVPFGDSRKAILYMPVDADKDDAQYVLDMIILMFKRVYKL